MSDHSATPRCAHCQNCGAALHGRFCHECGQQDIDFHRSFGHVFLEALESFLHFDEKFFRTVLTLLFHPGRLSADFNAGRRASQMPPFRLYLFISVLFFFIRFLAADESGGDAGSAGLAGKRAGLVESIRELAEETSDPAAKQRLLNAAEDLRNPALRNAGLTDEQLRDLPAVLTKRIRQELAAEQSRSPQVRTGGSQPWVKIDENDAKSNSAWDRYLRDKAGYAIEHQQEIQEAFVHALPKMLLVCLPLFALYTRVLFRHGSQVFLQHLVIALHYHTFVFLWWAVTRGWHDLLGLGSPFLAGVVAFGAGLWMFLYPFLMLRRLFGQSWLRTSLKAFVLTGAYGATLAIGFLLTAIIVFLAV